MKQFTTDNYTKGILTIIALCLILLTLKSYHFTPKLFAINTHNEHTNSPLRYGLVPINKDGSINVRLNNTNELNVNIVGINTTDELDINIDEIGGKYVSSGGPIAVEIK